jgi:uncharacterized protein YbcC (UPF0753/DUF2309 family)
MNGTRGSHVPSLKDIIEHAAHLLPAQGPITVFIHHNTLHAFEDLPFDEAVKKAARVFGCHPYLTEDQYREHLRRGRIRFSELQSVVEEDLGTRAHKKMSPPCTPIELRLAMLQYPLRFGPTHELLWYVAEKDALRRIRSETSSAVRDRLIAETRRWVMRDLRAGKEATPSRRGRNGREQLARILAKFNEATIETWKQPTWEAFTLQAMWRLCCDGVADVPQFTAPPPMPSRPRDLLLEATGEDADQLVHHVLIRWCAAFLDQGFASWQLPRRDQGFYQAFCALYRQAGGPQPHWMRGLGAEFARLQDEKIGALESIAESLKILGISELEQDEFIGATLLALRGWGGMIREVEMRGDRVVRPVPTGTLVDFLAIRLLLDRWALASIARHALGYSGPLCELASVACKHIEAVRPPSIEQRAFLVFQLAQVLGWTPEDLYRLDRAQWSALLEEIETFSRLERRGIFHLAYERRFNTQTLDAVALHAPNPAPTPRRPRFQASFCLDDREESMRRHLEEVAPDVETFAVAGFYFIPMYFRGAADAHFVPLCPVVIRPEHWVTEQVVESHEKNQQRRARARRALGIASHRIHLGTRAFASGALLSAALGVLASIPLIARTILPRLTARIRTLFAGIVQTPPETRLQLERHVQQPGSENGQIGFNLDEMTDIAERVLRDMGLTAHFSRLVLTIGHGSASMNNPHASAYNCGACGGASGGPNGRAFAQMMNDRRIQDRLAERGLIVPSDTVFVGGYHDTCSDTIVFYDLDGIPASHQAEFDGARATLDTACARNAHERSRRFMSAPLTQSFASAKQHVEGRAADLAQVRPELGHATNAINIVGRRNWSRGLFLDRRAFLTSYDPSQDDEDGTILTRILLAIFPVCAGINLEYYFSLVDNARYGCGSKLPHNVSAMLGVMDGPASDLRTGLPWQMVEIHEPVRLLNVIETTPEAMLKIMERNPGIARLCRNGWVHLTVLHPQTCKISVFKNGRFIDYEPTVAALPKAATSMDWYRGWREHLEFATIGAAAD